MMAPEIYRDVKGWTSASFGSFTRSDAAYFAAEIRRARLGMAYRNSVLEIGFGNGGFGGWCHSQGWAYTGTEADPELVRRARAIGWDGRDSSALPSGRFDAIVAFDVFEHLELATLRSMLSECRERLSSRGCIIARMPSGDSPFSGAIFNGDLTHRLLLGSQAVRQLAAEAGLSVRSITSPALPLSGAGPISASRRVGVKALSGLVSFAVRAAFHSGQRSVITANMVVVLTA
jgi:hypothetical protein